MSELIKRGTFPQSNPVVARWRFYDGSRAAYTQADITSMKYDAIQLQPYSATLLANDTALVVADTVYDTLQVESDDAGWEDDDDATGYNCKTTFPGTLFATAGLVRIEVYATPSAEGATQVRCATFEITVDAAYGS